MSIVMDQPPVIAKRRYVRKPMGVIANLDAGVNIVRFRLGRIVVERVVSKPVAQQLVVSYGMGTDSTAMLILMQREGIRPDLILFADTGGEKPGTYDYLTVMDTWLMSKGFPRITVVKKNSKHDSLEQNCIANLTLPSLAYGRKGCSLKWKGQAMDVWLNSFEPAALSRSLGMRTIRAIGYDASPADSRRSKIRDNTKDEFWYPLRERNITRQRCMDIIEEEGLPQPGKSACFFCPATKKEELLVLMEHHPDLVARSLRIEAHASVRGFDGSTKGLGRNWNWREFLSAKRPAGLQALAAAYDIGQDVLPLEISNRQTTIFDEATDETLPVIKTDVSRTLSRLDKRWYSNQQIANALRVHPRDSFVHVRRHLNDGTWSADRIMDGGFTIPVFRPKNGTFAEALDDIRAEMGTQPALIATA